MFIDSRTTVPGSRSDIAWYNETVRTALRYRGHRSIRSHRGEFAAVVSTTAVDARDNTGTTGTGVPIYWLNGHKVADDYSDFYDGAWDSIIARDESGGLVYDLQDVHVWTGSTADGREFINEFGHSRALGEPSVSIGRPWFDSVLYSGGRSFANTEAKHLYGLSDVFRIPGRVRLSWSPSRRRRAGERRGRHAVAGDDASEALGVPALRSLGAHGEDEAAHVGIAAVHPAGTRRRLAGNSAAG